jgi:tetratricopeptide (TPR) repeat protein
MSDNEASEFDQPSDFRTTAEVKRALEEIQNHANRAEWLHQHREQVYKTICFGLQVDSLYFEAIAALLTALPSIHEAYERWSGLILDAIVRSSTLRDHSSMVRLYSGLARFYALTGRAQSAQTATKNAFNHLTEETKQETIVESFICLVEVLLYHFDRRLSPDLLDKLLSFAQHVRDPLLMARTHLVLSRAYTSRGDIEEALVYGMRAFEYFSGVKDDAGVFRSAMTIAKAYRYTRMFANAEHYLQIALRCDPKSKLAKDMGDLFYELGAVAYEQAYLGDDVLLYHEAEHYYTQSRDWYNQTRAPFHYAAVFQALGLLQIRLEQYDAAQGNLELAAESWKKLNNLYERVQTHYTLSFLEAHRQNFKLSRILAQEALKMAKPLPESTSCRDLCNDIRLHIERLDTNYYLKPAPSKAG